MADVVRFTASARLPFRPLSQENVAMAENKEVIVDYANAKIYIKTLTGEVVDVTASTIEIINEFKTEIVNNPDVILDTNITLDDGTQVELGESIVKALGDIKELQTNLQEIDDLKQKVDQLLDEEGKVVAEVDASNVVETQEKQFVSEQEKTVWNSSTNSRNLTMTINGGSTAWTGEEAPYVQTIQNSDIFESDYPIVDVKLSSAFKEAMEQLNNYAYIYKILTFDGYIEVYATKKTEVNLTITLKVHRPVASATAAAVHSDIEEKEPEVVAEVDAENVTDVIPEEEETTIEEPVAEVEEVLTEEEVSEEQPQVMPTNPAMAGPGEM